MGRLLPGEGSRKNDGSIAKGAKPGREIKRTPQRYSSTVQRSAAPKGYRAPDAKTYYASLPPGQRKAQRDSTGVLAPSYKKSITSIHKARVRAFKAMEHAALYANANANKPVWKAPTAAEKHGLAVATERAQRHGQSLDSTLAPFRVLATLGTSATATVKGEKKKGGGLLDDIGSGLEKAGKWAGQALLDEQATNAGSSFERHNIEAVGGDPAAGGDEVNKVQAALAKLGKEWGHNILSQNQPGGKNRLTAGFDEKSGEKLGTDVLTLPGQAVASVSVPAREAAKTLSDGDPSHLGKAAGDVLGGYVQLAKHPLATLQEHPLGTALMVAGFKGAVGRGVGGAARSGALGRGARDAASLERAPATADGVKLQTPRRYSRDAFDKAAQVLAEKHRQKVADKLNADADNVEAAVRHRMAGGTPAKGDENLTLADAKHLRDRAAKYTRGKRLNGGDVKKATAIINSALEDVRRVHRAETRGVVGKALGKVSDRNGQVTTTSLIAQNIIAPTLESLRSYRDLVMQEGARIESPAKLQAHRRSLDKLDRAIKHFDAGHAEVAARRYAEATGTLNDELVHAGVITPEQAAMAKWVPYARAQMGLKWDDTAQQLTTQAGSPVRLSTIEAHARAHGFENPPAWVSQSPSKAGFNIRHEGGEPKAGAHRRSGDATMEGTFDMSAEALHRSAALQRGLVDAVKGYRKFIDEGGWRDGDGKLIQRDTYKKMAALVKDRNTAPGALKMRVVRLTPFGAKAEQIGAALDSANSGLLGEGVNASLQDALANKHPAGDGKGEWVAIPEAMAKELDAQLNTGGSVFGKVGDVGLNVFRRTVLPFSPSWALNNLTEGTLRATIAGAGPTNYIAARRSLVQAFEENPQAAEMAKAMLTPGGLASFQVRSTIFRDFEQFEGSRIEPIVKFMHGMHDAPVTGWVPKLFMLTTDAIFHGMGKVESQFQIAMLGKALKNEGLRDGGIGALGMKAMEEAGRGLTDTSNQVMLARRLHDMYGKYSGYSAGVRKAMSTAFPFAPWWLSAVKFVGLVLPRDHPVLTGLLASTVQAQEEWRKIHGLEPYVGLFHQAPGAVPSWMEGSVPTGGGMLQITKGTPFSVADNPLESIAGMLLPQASGIVKAFQGLDWKNKQLRNPDGTPADMNTKLSVALTDLLEQSAGPYTLIKRAVSDPSGLVPYRPYKSKDQTDAGPLAGFAKKYQQVNGGGADKALANFAKVYQAQNGGTK